MALCSRKTQFISDLRAGSPINTVLIVTDCQQKQGKNGQAYLDVKLADRTGEINMKLWNHSPGATPGLEQGAFIRLNGVCVTEFAGRLQLALDSSAFGKSITPEDEAQCNPGDFVPSTERDIPAMWRVLTDAISSVEKLPIRCLLESYFCDPEFAAAFRDWPAAVRHHHAYCGGLLEHTVGVLQICMLAAENYSNVDRDFVIAGALLHDVGKLSSHAYDKTRGITGMSLQGIAADHIVLGSEQIGARIRMLTEACPKKEQCREACWDQKMALYMAHLIVSHHGTKEWGSPVEPATIEACILHFADNMDAQVNKFERALREPFSESDDGFHWSESLGRSVWSLFRGGAKP